jgi:large conductance mechanosensitive channel
MSLIREFREFAVRGNVVDLAVAVIIGAAFNKIVSSLVEDIVMPAVGALGGVDFKELVIQVGAARILYGKFIQTCIDFLVIAASVFVAVKVINAMRQKEQDKPPAAPPPREERLLEEIRDLLKRIQPRV